MQSNKPTAAALALTPLFAFGAPATSADLPQADSFTTHNPARASVKWPKSEKYCGV
jgi:hypothetical protein